MAAKHAGKMALEDALLVVAVTAEEQAALPCEAWQTRITLTHRPCFHAAFTLSGLQPSIVIPQVRLHQDIYSVPTILSSWLCNGRVTA